MNKLGLALISLCFVACSNNDRAEKVGFTETKLVWQGAKAEQIDSIIRGLAPPLKMAVINDNEALLYYESTTEQTMQHLDNFVDRPYGLMIAPPSELGEALPKPPQSKQIQQVEWIAKPQAIEATGVSKTGLIDYLKQLNANALKPETFKDLTYTIESSDKIIPLGELVDHRIIYIQRPLIFITD